MADGDKQGMKGLSMTIISLYLNFNGNTEEAFRFYQSVFGGEFSGLQRFAEIPDGDKLSPADQQKIVHIALRIGENMVLQGTDILESLGQTLTEGNNIYISLEPESRQEAERLFDQLSVGGGVEMPLQEMFWGAYYGVFTDRFGIQWMVNHDPGGSKNVGG